jgi:predicted house-cleaning noncanonical NTP pyrophosphatase (MazG superfamily)
MLPFWRDQPGGTVQVMRVTYHKLVRDRIPAIIAADGGRPVTRVLDVLEVLQALAAAHDVGWEDIVSEASRKRSERGGFDQRIFLEHVDQAR